MNDNVVKEKLCRRDLLYLYQQEKQLTKHQPSLIPKGTKKIRGKSTRNLTGKIKQLSGQSTRNFSGKRNLESKMCSPDALVKRVHTEVSQKSVSKPCQIKNKLLNAVTDNGINHVENPARSNCKALDEIDRLPEDADESNIENESSGVFDPNVLYFHAVHQNEEMETPKKYLQFPQADSESQKRHRSDDNQLPKKLPAHCHLQKSFQDVASSALEAEKNETSVFPKGLVANLVRQFEGSTTTSNVCQKNTTSELINVCGSVLEKTAKLALASQKTSSCPPPFGGYLLPGFQPSSPTRNQVNLQAENVLEKYLPNQHEESFTLFEQFVQSCKNDNERASSLESSFTSDISDENFRVLDEQCFPSFETIHTVNVSPEKSLLELMTLPKLTVTKSPSVVNQNPPLSIHDCEQLVQPVYGVAFSGSHIFSDDSDNKIEFKKSSPFNSMPPATQLLLKRRGTPRPSKTPKRKDSFLDSSVDFEQTGCFTANIVRFAKNGDATVTPVRRSRRLSSTPSVVRKELERFC